MNFQRRLLHSQAQVVVAGGGLIGNSVAYHLAQRKLDVCVLEARKIGEGTSTHFSHGIIGPFKPLALRRVIGESQKLYEDLEKKGYNIGLKKCGSLNLAQTKDRLIALQRHVAYSVPTGLACQLIGPTDIQKLHPHLYVADLEGAVYVESDAVADPSLVCHALADLAKSMNVHYEENCPVTGVLTENGRVTGVQTDQGVIKTEYFVNCTGIWARTVGLLSKQCPVRIPVYPALHFQALTSDMGLNRDEVLPIVRDFDYFQYFHQLPNGNMSVGFFEENAKSAFEKDIPADWSSHLEHDQDHFKPLYEKAKHRMPILNKCQYPTTLNFVEESTPDGRWILGETAEVKNYYVAVGTNGNALQSAGGIGKYLSEMIVEGTKKELLPFSAQRFLDLHNNRQYLENRIKEVVGRKYAILYPQQTEYRFGRQLRCSPIYKILESRGAVFGTKMAYERALYFDSNYTGGPLPKLPPGTFFKPKFFDFLREEYLACRETVGIIDISSFSKIRITSSGKAVVDYLQKLCSNDIDIPVNSIVKTGMQNESGGYENDCTLLRESDNSYFMVSPSSQQTRVFEYMRRYLEPSIRIKDVTSMYTVINVVGPKSTSLLSELSNSDVHLPPMTYKKINIGFASEILVAGYTHTGEPGYCLYVPSEYAIHVYESLVQFGLDYGIRDVGTIVQRWLRLERFVPFWGEELSNSVTPFEAGFDQLVKFEKEYFIGKSALFKQKNEGITKRLVMFLLEDIDADKDVWPWANEAIYRNGEFFGFVTSAGYGFTTEKLVCLGFIQRPDGGKITPEFIMDKSAVYEIDIAGRKCRATASITPPTFEKLQKTEKQTKYKPVVSKRKSV